MLDLLRSCLIAKAISSPAVGAIAPTIVRRLFSSTIAKCENFPPFQKVLFPSYSPTMTTGSLISWNVGLGEKVSAGDVIASIETDKATVDFESSKDFYVAKFLVAEGTREIPIGQPVIIGVSKPDLVAAFENYVEPPFIAASEENSAVAVEGQSTFQEHQPVKDSQSSSPIVSIPDTIISTPSPTIVGGFVPASPLAHRTAKDNGIDLSTVTTHSGYGSIIIQSDVEKAINANKVKSAQPCTTTDVPISTEEFNPLDAVRSIPHFYLTADVSLDNALATVKSLSELSSSESPIRLDSLLLRAVVSASRKIPAANSQWMGTFIREHYSINVHFLSQDKDFVISNVEKLGLAEITSKLSMKDVPKAVGSTIAVSSFIDAPSDIQLGSYSPIIRPPHAVHLAISSPRTVSITDPVTGFVTKKTLVSATLSCDHRIVDGAVGAQWLSNFRSFVESPNSLLL